MRNYNRRFEIRRERVRSRISKYSERFRLSVFRSGKHLYAQIIDDTKSNTIVAVSTLHKDIKKINKSNSNIESAIQVGELLGAKASKLGVTKVVFDKGGYKYHGVVKALADAARKNLEF